MASDDLWGTERVGVLLQDQCQRISQAAIEPRIASGWTHPLYRHPASESLDIARTAVMELSNVGHVILDPFSGGGTTGVEALSEGRRAICSDLNTLACLVARSKGLPVSEEQLALVDGWVSSTIEWLRANVDIIHVPMLSEGRRYVPATNGRRMCEGEDAAKCLTEKGRILLDSSDSCAIGSRTLSERLTLPKRGPKNFQRRYTGADWSTPLHIPSSSTWRGSG
jgi:hypothetical protein